MGMEIKVKGKGVREGEELKEILDAVANFLKEIKEPLQDLINTVLSAFRGDKLGEEVASFYKNLVDSGVPRDVASKMAESFLEQRMSILDVVGKLSKLVSEKAGRVEVKREEE